ncbi:MAG: ABC transporter permease [Burkholderiales bacterium]|nr:MAG: ABC transporter permease [Burkholderiales bacterium]
MASVQSVLAAALRPVNAPPAVLAWLVPIASIVVGLLAFGVFVALLGRNPLEVYATIFEGGFASAFSWNNTLLRAAPLILTGLAVAIPAQAGLVVIGGEGALALGALAAAAVAVPLAPSLGAGALVAGAVAGAAAGGLWFALTGYFRAYRGLNETISSLLLSYIAIAVFNHLVEGPLRDPASLNKPSTLPLPDAAMIGQIPWLDVHWGLAIGLVACLIAQLALSRSTQGFALRVAGGNPRAAMLVGLPVGALIVAACALGGAAAGLAGAIEVMAVHSAASASVLAGYGTTGILVAFMARQQPLAIVPVAILMGGIAAAGSLLQRRLDLPDATTLVLQGLLFVSILAGEAFMPKERR